MSYFDAYGPFEITATGRAVTGAQAEFWQSVDARQKGLRTAIGCYVFCIQSRQRIRPWYVGMTTARTGFKGEIFQDHKLNAYNECLSKQSRGRAIMFLFPLITTDVYKFSKAGKSKKREIELLEITLMGFAHRQNSEIANIRDMHFLRNVEVLGLIGKRRGRPYREAQAVRQALLGLRVPGR